MNIFVLLLYVGFMKSGGGFSAEFNSESACRNAAKQFIEKMEAGRSRLNGPVPIKWVCVPKD